MSRFYPMVQIPGGEEDLRDDRKKLQWKATIPPFLLGAYPVTNELYEAVVGDSDTASNSSHSHQMPVVNISWKDAVGFCNLLSQRSGLTPCYSIGSGEAVQWNVEADGYRLPTEAEWQYACKAGNSSYQYGKLDQIAWYNDNSQGMLHEVGNKEPNAWGLYDMLGNVWEWCWDIYDEQVYGSYRVFRGGAGLKKQEDAEQPAVGAATPHSVSRILDSV
ncbi:conserved protein of unknown function [Paenibacillus alvei]|uniref:Sulfatase-modifying factor enzyme-like domain-containing protein n=1 Tax=Paenibacillus alvei TaxID=44250 RepID=A0A383R7B8_PAEAL|nr:conserved protein of unknown function [Paenibacillus alvei]